MSPAPWVAHFGLARTGLDPTRHQVIYIANPAFGTRGLYVTIVRALGAQPRYLKAELMAQAGDLLAAETAPVRQVHPPPATCSPARRTPRRSPGSASAWSILVTRGIRTC